MRPPAMATGTATARRTELPMAARTAPMAPTARMERTAMASRLLAVYPGTFDPITNGHMDIIRRAADITDHLIIAVAKNAGKNPLLTLEDRLALVREEIADLNKPGRKVEARTFDNLLMHFAE